MRIEKFGHACLLLETPNARVLVDPGTFSAGFEQVQGLTALAFTHAHADHIDEARVPELAAANPDATIIADRGTVDVLAGLGIMAEVADPRRVFDVGERLEVIGECHAPIHDDIPVIPNVGYLFAERLFHPGDALSIPEREVEIVAVPVVAPWMRVSEGIDFLRAVSPSVAIPIHEAIASRPLMYYNYFRDLGPASCRLQVVEDPIEL